MNEQATAQAEPPVCCCPAAADTYRAALAGVTWPTCRAHPTDLHDERGHQ